MFYTLVRKDLLLELRTKEIIIPMFAFGLVIILIFSLSFNASQEINHTFSPGLLWIIILFISSLGLHRMFVLEKEFDAFTLNLAAPIDRGVIFLSKVVSGTIILLIAEILIIPPFVIFLNLSIFNILLRISFKPKAASIYKIKFDRIKIILGTRKLLK